jgi:hypothetical protein
MGPAARCRNGPVLPRRRADRSFGVCRCRVRRGVWSGNPALLSSKLTISVTGSEFGPGCWRGFGMTHASNLDCLSTALAPFGWAGALEDNRTPVVDRTARRPPAAFEVLREIDAIARETHLVVAWKGRAPAHRSSRSQPTRPPLRGRVGVGTRPGRGQGDAHSLWHGGPGTRPRAARPSSQIRGGQADLFHGSCSARIRSMRAWSRRVTT